MKTLKIEIDIPEGHHSVLLEDIQEQYIYLHIDREIDGVYVGNVEYSLWQNYPITRALRVSNVKMSLEDKDDRDENRL